MEQFAFKSSEVLSEGSEGSDGNTEERYITLPVAQLDPPPEDTPLTEAQRQQCEFVPLEQSPIWSHVLKGDAFQNSWCLQSWIQSYAELISHWLYLLKDNSTYDSGQPIYLLQAEANHGQFGLSLVQAVKQKLQQIGLDGIKFCYLFAVSEDTQQERLLEHPLFEILAEQQQAKVLRWDVQKDIEIPHQDVHGETLALDANPVVFIANGVLSALPQQLLYVHYSDVYVGEVATYTEEQARKTEAAANSPLFMQQFEGKKDKPSEEQKREQEAVSQKLAYRWHPTTPEEFAQQQPEYLQDFIRGYLAQELTQCRSEPLLVSIAALKLLGQFKQACTKGVLSLSSDFGVTTLFPLAQSFPLKKELKEAQFRLPVNLAMLSQYQKKHLGWGKLLQDRATGKALNICWVGEFKQEDVNLLKAVIAETFNGQTPEVSELILDSLHKTTEALTEAQILAYLTLHQYEPKLLEIFLPRLLEEGVAINQRIQWCTAISKVWNLHTPVVEKTKLAFKLGLFAIDLSHWDLAKQCFISIMQLQGANLACLHNLALVAFSTDQMELANQCITGALEIASEDEQSLKLQADINTYAARCEKLDWYTPAEKNTGTHTSLIKLMPLGEQHLNEYYLQYRNPNIAKRVRSVELNEFDHLQQLWPQWQQAGDDNQKAHYAVLHRKLGFVGCVMLDFDDESNVKEATLSFWIGTDYQGNGFGNEAVKQAIRQAQQLANKGLITALKTSVWEHNHASRKVLSDNGLVVINEVTKQELFGEVNFRRFLSNSSLL